MNLRQAAQQALEALIPLANAGCPNERECLTDEDHERAVAAVEALEQDLAKPEQEPVAWISESENLLSWDKFYDHMKPLYTAPTPRKPLTDAEIWNTYKNLWMFHPAEEPRLAGDVLKFARAIERAHGIGEQHE